MALRTTVIAALCGLGLSLSGCVPEPAPTRDGISAPFQMTDGASTAPFGGAVSPDIVNYTRAAPYVGTAGKLTGDGVEEAKRLGFKLIIDLRRPEEDGVAEEQAKAAELGLAYLNLPLAADETAWDQVRAVETALADAANYPVLLHCGSANRAGAVWALYRYKQGVSAVTALEEGLATGLTSREKQVRELLNLPPA